MRSRHTASSRQVRSAPALTAELLESRLLFSGSYTWTGLADGRWSNPANWAEQAAPAGAFNTLLFPEIAVTKAMTNDLAGLGVSVMEFHGGGYALSGSPLAVSGTIACINDGVSRDSNTIETPIEAADLLRGRHNHHDRRHAPPIGRDQRHDWPHQGRCGHARADG